MVHYVLLLFKLQCKKVFLICIFWYNSDLNDFGIWDLEHLKVQSCAQCSKFSGGCGTSLGCHEGHYSEKADLIGIPTAACLRTSCLRLNTNCYLVQPEMLRKTYQMCLKKLSLKVWCGLSLPWVLLPYLFVGWITRAKLAISFDWCSITKHLALKFCLSLKNKKV